MLIVTVEDIEDRWRPLSDAEKAVASRLIGDAEIIVERNCPADPEVDDSPARIMVIATMVKRAMMAGTAAMGVSQQQQSAGPFQNSVTYTNPTGDLYMTKQDRRNLGCSRQKAYGVDMVPAPTASTDLNSLYEVQ